MIYALCSTRYDRTSVLECEVHHVSLHKPCLKKAMEAVSLKGQCLSIETHETPQMLLRDRRPYQNAEGIRQSWGNRGSTWQDTSGKTYGHRVLKGSHMNDGRTRAKSETTSQRGCSGGVLEFLSLDMQYKHQKSNGNATASAQPCRQQIDSNRILATWPTSAVVLAIVASSGACKATSRKALSKPSQMPAEC